jgi:hypothetical protein
MGLRVHREERGKGFGEGSEAFPLGFETGYEGEDRTEE